MMDNLSTYEHMLYTVQNPIYCLTYIFFKHNSFGMVKYSDLRYHACFNGCNFKCRWK